MAAPIGALSLGTSVAGGILGAVGASRTAEANAQMYGYQAQVARINAQIDKQNADYARNVGEQNAQIAGLKGAQQFGQIRAAEGASGLDVNSGSNAEVQASQRKITQMDVNTIRSNAAKTAYDYEVKSVNDLNQAGLYDAAASNAKAAGSINVAASLIGAAGTVATRWQAGAQSGLFAGGGGGSASSGITLYGPNQEVVGYYA